MIKGVCTAIVTPFKKSGEIDWISYEKLIEIQVTAGVSGVVVTGTTGESATLNLEEKKQLWQKTISLLKGTKTKAIAGTGTNNTLESVEMTQIAQGMGYSDFLVVTPYYNKPSQEGLYAHYSEIAKNIRGEIILYNVPGRTGVSLSAKTISRLFELPQITSIKEATGDLTFLDQIKNEINFDQKTKALLSGDDATTLSFIKKGGVGCISVASIVAPQLMVKMVENKDEEIHKKLSDLFKTLFIESNPAPVKFMLSKMGLVENILRLPLVPVQKESEQKLNETLSKFKINQGQLFYDK